MGVDAVLEGFATALQHMHRGDHWRVTIPYQLGYGTSDYNSIPGYSTLIFDIRLVDFEEGSNG
jgi:FKBP-type peptidyl-prolyl cis-trans isomerase FklB